MTIRKEYFIKKNGAPDCSACENYSKCKVSGGNNKYCVEALVKRLAEYERREKAGELTCALAPLKSTVYYLEYVFNTGLYEVIASKVKEYGKMSSGFQFIIVESGKRLKDRELGNSWFIDESEAKARAYDINNRDKEANE